MATAATSILSCVAGAATTALFFILSNRRNKGKSSDGGKLEERSTTSSAGGGAAAYETTKAVDEYLQFHFGADQDILPYAQGPKVMPSIRFRHVSEQFAMQTCPCRTR